MDLDKAKNWREFWNRLRGIVPLPDPMLAFEFLPNLSGLSYQLIRDNIRDEYLRSSLLVRDRLKLEESETWRKHGGGFKKQFVVGCGGHWYYCPASVWSPSVDAEFLLVVASAILWISEVDSILDLGCGTGVLGLGVARIAQRIRKLSLVDSNPFALASAAINAACHEYCDCDIHLGTQPPSADFDLGITAPYYFPVAKTTFKDPHAAIREAGYHAADLVLRCAAVCRRVLFIYSSVTEAEFRGRFNRPFNILGRLTIPFSLGDNVSSLQLLRVAIDSGRLLVRPNDEQFPYGHTITIAEVCNG